MISTSLEGQEGCAWGGQPSAWKSADIAGIRFFYAGREASVRLFIEAATRIGYDNPIALGRIAASLPGHFSCIVKSRGWQLALVDSIRSYPIFYNHKAEERFSPYARRFLSSNNTFTVDEFSFLEFLMAGYVTDNRTLYDGIMQLRPGELALLHEDKEIQTHQYYTFQPSDLNSASRKDILEQLGLQTNTIFSRLISETEGRPVLVPLSGGLDSRLVLAKLVELGCPKVSAFSYGLPGNGEAVIAQKVANRLGVPWVMLPTSRQEARKAFMEDDRRQYWKMADGLCSVPNMQEYLAFHLLTRDNLISRDSIIVNGQSGDFITGGHIPKNLLQPNAGWHDLFPAIIKKHFALWPELQTPNNLTLLEKTIQSRLKDLLGQLPENSEHGWAYAWNVWEWAERQTKYVVNQQRTYDFFGFSWQLPLWDREYLDFWRNIPAPLMFGQKLYKDYLRNWDFKGLFTDPSLSKPISHWPGVLQFVPLVARSAWLLGGSRAKNAVYSWFRYFGHYSFQYGSYPYGYYFKRSCRHRNNVSLFAETWVHENLPIPCPLDGESLTNQLLRNHHSC